MNKSVIKDQCECELKMLTGILLNETKSKNIPSQKKFQCWINTVIKNIPKKILNKIPKTMVEICIVIVDKKTSAKLNKIYRQKKGATNVLSFTYETIPGILKQSLGDLVICAALVEKEAILQKKKRESHWAHLTVHGILHLLSYDHMIDQDAMVMETLEMKILNQMSIENPYE